MSPLLPFTICLTLAAALQAAGPDPGAWHPVPGSLLTRWAAGVNPTNAWPEYPRPQLVRPDWTNLNGLWDYAITAETELRIPSFTGKILVPFPIESALSGVKSNFNQSSKLWYHRTFAVPENWRGRRIRLHFGAVDWACGVQVNGRNAGQHQGGYDAFTFDITDALQWNGAEDLAVWVTDPTEGDQPRGKQSRKPDGIFYTASSGIWQTVWLEPVSEVCIDRLTITPDVDAGTVHVRASVGGFAPSLRVEVAAASASAGRVIARVTGTPNTDLTLNLPAPHPWSPDDPFLYDLQVRLLDGENRIDDVASYFGLRKIALARDGKGVTRIALNNQFVFQLGTLDQGFWPDGIYTAPTDEALRSDISFLKEAGFNLIRKHVKVEPDRWYYWCDKLGLLVWQDMPSANNGSAEGRRDFESELLRMVEGLKNHPSIVTWVLFNEGWGQYGTEGLATWLQQLDPTRLVDDASGWTDMHVGNIIDMHNYPGPNSPAPETNRAAVLGEFGGFGLVVTNHYWSGRPWGYVMLADEKELEERYRAALKKVWRLNATRGLSAAVYTQTSDVETECNGLLSYDRAVEKIDPAVLLAANRGNIFAHPFKLVLADGLFGGATWKYTTNEPAVTWFAPDFAVAHWKEGTGGFGSPETPGIRTRTSWKSGDIWLRANFQLDAADIAGLKLQLFHDENVEIYLNGVPALQLDGFITDYDEFDLSEAARAGLHPGTNLIAVHCHQTTGGQGIDVGLLAPSPR